MGRPQRIDNAGDYHHVVNRGRNRQDVFGDDDDRLFFLEPLRTAVHRGYVEVHSFTLMSNHYHALLRSLIDGGTSRTMQLLGIYTLEFNRKYGVDGSLFKGRFYSKRIDTEGYLIEVPRYIANNPVKAGLALTPNAYKWSSHATILGEAHAIDFPVAAGLVDEFFNGNVLALDRFIRARDTRNAVRFEQAIEANLVEPSLEASLDVVALGLRRLDEIPLRYSSMRRSQQMLTTFVCESLQIQPVAIVFAHDESTQVARALLLTLFLRCGIADLKTLAGAFGYTTKQATSCAIRRFESEAARDPALGKLLRNGLSLSELAA